MSFRTRAWCVAFAVVMCAPPAASAAMVHALAIPRGYTIPPEGDHRLMVVASDGTVYADLTTTTDPLESVRAIRWTPAGSAELLPTVRTKYNAPRLAELAAGSSGAYITIGGSFSGAYSGTTFWIAHWGAELADWEPAACVEAGNDSVHVAAVDGQRIAITVDPSSNRPSVNSEDESSLPSAYVIKNGACTNLGTALLTAMRGNTVVGYIGLLDGKPAPIRINAIIQHRIAKRWLGGKERDLGPGVPFATTSGGVVVGATALPGYEKFFVQTNWFGEPGTYRFPVPHAAMWTAGGKASLIVRDDARSVAWDVDDAGTIVGMLQSAGGRHHAFRAAHGVVQLLDDLPHPRGWRFESAYAIAPDGSIVGTGTYDGRATAFQWRS